MTLTWGHMCLLSLTRTVVQWDKCCSAHVPSCRCLCSCTRLCVVSVLISVWVIYSVYVDASGARRGPALRRSSSPGLQQPVINSLVYMESKNQAIYVFSGSVQGMISLWSLVTLWAERDHDLIVVIVVRKDKGTQGCRGRRRKGQWRTKLYPHSIFFHFAKKAMKNQSPIFFQMHQVKENCCQFECRLNIFLLVSSVTQWICV